MAGHRNTSQQINTEDEMSDGEHLIKYGKQMDTGKELSANKPLRYEPLKHEEIMFNETASVTQTLQTDTQTSRFRGEDDDASTSEC